MTGVSTWFLVMRNMLTPVSCFRNENNGVIRLTPLSSFIWVTNQAVEEVPVRNMAARLGIERGTLQALQKEASVFCGMVVCFCRHLQWHELANVLHSFQVTRRGR